MATQDLTFERACEAFRYDPDSGMLYRRHGERERVGTARSNGYLLVSFGNRTYMVHRVAWLLIHGTWPVGPIKHINQIKTDNRRVNLRCEIDEQGEANLARTASTRDIGVIPEGDRWIAVVSHDETLLRIGPFDTHSAAHDAYATAASTALWREPRRSMTTLMGDGPSRGTKSTE